MAFMAVSFRLNGRDFQKIIIANGRDLSNSDLQEEPGPVKLELRHGGPPSLAIAGAIG
jgi:hypothetical protein